jgi:DNA-binding NarL/FixJ family response regulator
MCSIFLLDDHPMVRAGLRDLFSSEDGYEVCGEASTVAEARSAIPLSSPDLILMDLTLPDGSGLELLKELREADDTTSVLVFSMHDEMIYALRVIRAGGKGYLVKGAPPEKILEAVDQVCKGSIHLSDKAARHILKNMSQGGGEARSQIESLSDREVEVFQFLGLGMANSEIAYKLKISPRTIDTHRRNIRTKLGLPDSLAVMRQAVIWVESTGNQGNQTP